MKRDREPIAQGVAVHYQPQRHLLKDRIILVTGASDGIGREAALTYARYSASVILLGRNDEKLRAVAQDEREGGLPARWFTPRPANLHTTGVPAAGAADKYALSPS